MKTLQQWSYALALLAGAVSAAMLVVLIKLITTFPLAMTGTFVVLGVLLVCLWVVNRP